MANPQQPSVSGVSNIDLAQLIAALRSTGPASNPALDNLIAKLDLKVSREIDEETAIREQQLAGRRANAENMVRIGEQEAARQNLCGHTKPLGKGTALAGQRTHSGSLTLICQYCGKEFSDPPRKPSERIPNGLMPDRHFVGGPQQ